MREQVEIDGYATPGPARPTGRGLEVLREQRVVEGCTVGLEDDSAPLDRRTALELIERDVHAGVVELPKRPFEAVLVDQPADVAELDIRSREQRAVRVVTAAVDGALEQVEERLVASCVLLGDEPASRGGRHGRPEEARQPARVAEEDP